MQKARSRGKSLQDRRPLGKVRKKIHCLHSYANCLFSLKLLQGVIVKQEAELAKQDKELKRLRQHRALLTLEAEVMEHEVSKQKTELEDYDKWRKGNRRWKTVAECLLDPSVPKLSRNAKNALKQELGITD